jgi:hypothetical protein
MSGDSDLEQAPHQTTIAAMPAWFMWVCPALVGSSDEETKRAAAGELKEQSMKAFAALRDAEPGSQMIQ